MRDILHNKTIRTSAALGKVIANARKSHKPKLTQEMLAKKVGINRRTLSEFEKGDNPNLATETLIKLFRILNLELVASPRKSKNIYEVFQEKADYEQRVSDIRSEQT